jgi:hypothetical protein
LENSLLQAGVTGPERLQTVLQRHLNASYTHVIPQVECYSPDGARATGKRRTSRIR